MTEPSPSGSLHLDERADGGFAFFIDGDLQFDTLDEALYHECMALPALCLSEPSGPEGLRVLICGGGDGLALRECLRFPGVIHVDLVDYAPEVVALGRTRFADLNARAFDDPRASVHIADAWEFLAAAAPYDVILCDFTVPRRSEDTRVFTREWYVRVGRALAPNGVAALNAVSPQTTPEAFWCLRRTVRAAGLSALPYRVCLPSFRAQGYGAWAFLLAAHRPLAQACLRSLRAPVATRQTDLSRLWRGARFTRAERHMQARVPVHTLANGRLLPLLLNPGREIDPNATGARPGEYDLDPLLRAIPVTHPYHTRAMVETLARQVVGSVRALDLRRLVDELLRRAVDLPRDLMQELGRLRDYLRERAARLESLGAWGVRLFAALVLLMTLANAVAPDNAFAKGSAGLGHASVSRGYAGSFSGTRGFSGATRGAGSFGGERGFGGSFGSAGRARSGSFGGESGIVSSSGFRHGYGQGEATDIFGYSYRPRTFRYCGSGYGHIHSYYYGSGEMRPNMPPPQEHQTLFVADDDMLVLDNGDVVITLSDAAYLLVTNGTVALMSSKVSDPLLPLYPAPELFQAITEKIRSQQATAGAEIAARRDWLSWVGWTSALFPIVAGDRTEMRNMEDLQRKLDTAMTRLGPPPAPPPPDKLESGAAELFVGGFLLPDRNVAVCGPDGHWFTTDGRQLWSGRPNEKVRPCPPELRAVLVSVMRKLEKEMTADLSSLENDFRQLQSERASLEHDLSEYQSIYTANGYQSDYEVDYGTEEIGVSDAIARTQNDLSRNKQDRDGTLAEREKSTADVERIRITLRSFGS